jgi:hypothetical protein
MCPSKVKKMDTRTEIRMNDPEFKGQFGRLPRISHKAKRIRPSLDESVSFFLFLA